MAIPFIGQLNKNYIKDESMGLSMGIVGLPNVGKSTLFNAITNSLIEAQNFPFCTIDPNKGIVPVPDNRLDVLGKISNTQKLFRPRLNLSILQVLFKRAQRVRLVISF